MNKDLKIKIWAKKYAFFLIFTLILGVVGKVMSIKAAQIIFIYLYFIGFPITTIIYVYVYMKWTRMLDDHEKFRVRWLTNRTWRGVHELMFSIANFIIIAILLLSFSIIKKCLYGLYLA